MRSGAIYIIYFPYELNESQKLVHWNNLMRDGAKKKQHQRQTESESVDMCTYNGIPNWEYLQKIESERELCI